MADEKPRDIKVGAIRIGSTMKTIRTLVMVGTILLLLFAIASMSSIAVLVVYDIPFGTEYQNWHSYWAAGAAVFTPFVMLAVAIGFYRNVKMGAHWFAIVFAVFYEAILLTLVGVTIYDMVTCSSADWWCYNTITTNITWRYWWYAASIWGQTLFFSFLLLIYIFLHKAVTRVFSMAAKSGIKPDNVSSIGARSSIKASTPVVNPKAQKYSEFIQKILGSHAISISDLHTMRYKNKAN
jgi:hypothetical protein